MIYVKFHDARHSTDPCIRKRDDFGFRRGVGAEKHDKATISADSAPDGLEPPSLRIYVGCQGAQVAFGN